MGSESTQAPTEDALVREELGRLLADRRFVRSGRLSRLLRCTVEKVLAGQGGEIKEYLIALEVYEKPSSYDPAIDSLVRVEVSRLRSKLLDYYATEGRDNALRIEFPKGTYAPAFVKQAAAASPAPEIPVSVSVPKRRFRLLGAALGLGALSVAAWQLTLGGKTAATPSIAVLPFASFSADEETQALAAGLTEDVTSALSQGDGWRIPARTPGSTSLQYRVDALLEGSVRRDGNRLHISAQLVNAKDGYYIWTKTFDRDGKSPLSAQAELAESLVSEVTGLRDSFRTARVTGNEAAREARVASDRARGIIDRNVRDHLIMANSDSSGREPLAELMSAIQGFEYAIGRDPSYAPAYGGLARAYSLAAEYDDRLVQKATEAALCGLRVDERLPEAHFVLGYGKFLRDWDLPAASREFKRTLELDPRNATACRLYADCSALLGDWDSGFAALRHARELTPGSPIVAVQMGVMLYHARRINEMLAHAHEVERSHPDLPQAHWLLGLGLEQQGKYAEAAAEFESCLRFSPRDVRATPALGHVYGLLGRRAETLRLIDTARDRSMKGGLGPTGVSLMYLGLGDREAALTWCEKAMEVREPALLYVRVDPRFDPLRTHPRFVALMRKLALD